MPELPEVQTTVDGLETYVVGRTITALWTDYDSPHYRGKQNIKDPAYFKQFKKKVTGTSIIAVSRRAKQIFITLSSGDYIAVHMKMTGHFLYGQWQWNNKLKKWQPPEGYWNKTWDQDKESTKQELPFSDPFNDFIHLHMILDNGMHLAFSDMRKFATIFLIEDQKQFNDIIAHYGPEPLEKGMTFDRFISRLTTRPRMQVKTALLDQSLVSGFGNIYTDEVLWSVGVHPESLSGNIPESLWRDIFTHGKKILRTALKHGGDSMGDYRKIDGRGGSFHDFHRAYQRENTVCAKPGCHGVLEKMQVGARIARVCPEHQQLY